MYYDKIDYDTIELSWEILKREIILPYIIHLVGTNGKGSTGRYLSSFLLQEKKTVLHYSSPHIINFNERIWINGENVSTALLESVHKKLLSILSNELIEKLTYFEYTTLLGLYLSSGKDYLVLEAGLGGEFDATNVVKNDLSIITTIGLDHQSFLGNTVEEIARTKMKSCDNSFILSTQVFDEVIKVKNEILSDKFEIKRKKYLCDKNKAILDLAEYLQENLQVVFRVLEYLGFTEKRYTLPKLQGRFEKFRPNIIVDVGHNPLAAQAIANELKKENKKIILVYNSFKDKDYQKVLEILYPYIKEIQIIKCKDDRIVEKSFLLKFIDSLGLKSKDFDIINLKTEENYLVFGSFLVVENFLKGYTSYEKR